MVSEGMRVRPENAALPLVIFVTFCPKNSAQAPTTQDVRTEAGKGDGQQRVGRGFGDHVDHEAAFAEVGLLATNEPDGILRTEVGDIGKVDRRGAVDQGVGAVGHGAVQPDKVVDAEAAETHRAPVDRQRAA